MTSPTVAVIIPTLNESANIADTIACVLSQGADEILVVDGGSTDETVAMAGNLGASVINASESQRANQMNEGARAAHSDVLVFLHADTRFLPGSLDRLREVMSDESIVGGGFYRRFRSDSRVLALSCRIGNERARRLGWFFGDQAIFARRSIFCELSGFPEVPRFEDLDFTRRLRTRGRTVLVQPGVETSARRFRKAPLRRLSMDVLLTVRHLCVSPMKNE